MNDDIIPNRRVLNVESEGSFLRDLEKSVAEAKALLEGALVFFQGDSFGNSLKVFLNSSPVDMQQCYRSLVMHLMMAYERIPASSLIYQDIDTFLKSKGV